MTVSFCFSVHSYVSQQWCVYLWICYLLWLFLCKSHSIRVRIICQNNRTTILTSSTHCKVLNAKLQKLTNKSYTFYYSIVHFIIVLKWHECIYVPSLHFSLNSFSPFDKLYSEQSNANFHPLQSKDFHWR